MDPWSCGKDPDPGIRASDQWIRLRIWLFSSLTFGQDANKKNIFTFKGTFTALGQNLNHKPVLWIRDILDPDPGIRASDQRVRLWILLFSPLTFKTPAKNYFYFWRYINGPRTEPKPQNSVVDPWHCGKDPDPGIRAADQWIRLRIWLRILLFSSLTFKTPIVFTFEVTFTSFL